MHIPTVINIRPSRLASDVSTSTDIRIYFAKTMGYMPLDPDSITVDTVYLKPSSGEKVDGSPTLADNGYLIIFKPTNPLQEGTSYQATVVGDISLDGVTGGVKDMHGKYLGGAYNWWFTTEGEALPVPQLISPANASFVESALLTWGEVDAEGVQYQVQVATNNNFQMPVFDSIVSTTSVEPDIPLDNVYYWRVRSVVDENTSPWSNVWYFRYAKADVVLDGEEFKVVSSKPPDGTVNLKKIETIEITMNNTIDIESTIEHPIYIMKQNNL